MEDKVNLAAEVEVTQEELRLILKYLKRIKRVKK